MLGYLLIKGVKTPDPPTHLRATARSSPPEP